MPAAVADFQRPVEPRPIAGEVGGIDRHAELGEVGKQVCGRGALVEAAQALLGEAAQGRGKRRQRQADGLAGPGGTGGRPDGSHSAAACG